MNYYHFAYREMKNPTEECVYSGGVAGDEDTQTFPWDLSLPRFLCVVTATALGTGGAESLSSWAPRAGVRKQEAVGNAAMGGKLGLFAVVCLQKLQT